MSATVPSTWPTIDTAPVDGTPILVFANLWNQDVQQMVPQQCVGYCRNGVWFLSGTQDYPVVIQPVQWQPLGPPPPVQATVSLPVSDAPADPGSSGDDSSAN